MNIIDGQNVCVSIQNQREGSDFRGSSFYELGFVICNFNIVGNTLVN